MTKAINVNDFGATGQSIPIQFLIEAIVLSVAGGLIGTGIVSAAQ